MIKLKDLLLEKTVRLSPQKDVSFGSNFLQLLGKKGKVRLDKKSVHMLAKIVRALAGKFGMGYSFTQHEGVDEAKERNYKEEYKKFQSSTESKKYRAELNKYNRQEGTYGNGDGKDASHKGGKIVGFEEESKNRGRAEKSRLKKEGKINEAKVVRLPNGVKVKIDFNGLTFITKTSNPVFLDRKEMMKFFQATSKYMR